MFVSGECDAGYYCSSGANVSTPTDGITGDICPAGFYCPTGSAAPVPCEDGKFLFLSYLSNFYLY